MGDLNYRMTGEPSHILQDLCKVASVVKTTSGLGDSWREKRWRQVFNVPTTEYNANRSMGGLGAAGGGASWVLPVDGVGGEGAATATATEEETAAWSEFQHLDELRAAMAGGHVFRYFY